MSRDIQAKWIDRACSINAISITIKEEKIIEKCKKNGFAHIGGGHEHKELGQKIYDIVLNAWDGVPKCEQWHMGKRVDIYDEKNKIVIEIGNTNPDAIIAHLRIANKYIVVPFQDYDKNIDVYIFEISDPYAYNDVLEEKQKELFDMFKRVYRKMETALI